MFLVSFCCLDPLNLLHLPFWPRFLAFLVVFFIAASLYQYRTTLSIKLLEECFFMMNGKPVKLKDCVPSRALPLFCTTDLQAGTNFYFTPKFIYGYYYGHADPGEFRLGQAAMASAAFPVAFAPCVFDISKCKFEGKPHNGVDGKTLYLSDGGVYDNLGEQWARGYWDRLSHWRSLPSLNPAPSQMIIINSSPSQTFQEIPWGAKIPTLGEIVYIFLNMNVLLYAVTNARLRAAVSGHVESPDPSKYFPFLHLSFSSVLYSIMPVLFVLYSRIVSS